MIDTIARFWLGLSISVVLSVVVLCALGLGRFYVRSSPSKASGFSRITVRLDQMGGVPCIRGLRIPVITVVRMVGNGIPLWEILDDYPDLEVEDVREALEYVAEHIETFGVATCYQPNDE